MATKYAEIQSMSIEELAEEIKSITNEQICLNCIYSSETRMCKPPESCERGRTQYWYNYLKADAPSKAKAKKKDRKSTRLNSSH